MKVTRIIEERRNGSFGAVEKKIRSLVLIIAAILTGAASFHSQTTPSQETTTSSISGNVFRSGTTEIILGAHLELSSAEIGELGDYDFNPAILNFLKGRAPVFTAVTDKAGSYSIQSLPAGET